MINQFFMIIMTILIIGTLIISVAAMMIGKYSLDYFIFVRLIIPMYVLILNLYVLMLDEREEYKYFKNVKSSVLF